MVVKFIKVHVKSGHLQQYLSAQEIWNRETQPAPGFLGSFCGRCDDEPETVNLLFWWRCREDLERWMSTEHDRIATLAKADEHYERIEVRVLDAALPPEMPFADLGNCP